MRIKGNKIGVDIDDTLLDFVGTYVLFHNQTYKTNIKKDDFNTYLFNKIRGGTMKEAVDSVKEFYGSSFFKEMQPLPNAVEVIQRLKKDNELFIVTSRPMDMREGTLEQISSYFSNLFSEIIFSSNKYTKAKNSGKTKAEICFDLNVSWLIDDSLIYTKECITKGIGAILLDSPWNQNGHIKGVNRVKNWKEIGELLK